MKGLISLVVLLILATLAFAIPENITLQWQPDPANTVQADTFIVSRQAANGPWQEVCRATPAQPTCQDVQVPNGQSCWKAQAMAGALAGPESAPVCRTQQQFTGTMTIVVAP